MLKKILFVSSLYPPKVIGGYELGCAMTVEALRKKGYEVTVLTSLEGADKEDSKKNIFRILRVYPDGPETGPLSRKLGIIFNELANRAVMRKFFKRYRPDLVYFWSIQGFSYCVLEKVYSLKIPVAFFFFFLWFVGVD